MRAVLLVAALLLSGCGARASGVAPKLPVAAAAPSASTSVTMAKLAGSQWRFVEVGGAAVPAGVSPMLRFGHGHASGRAGCNSFGARFEVTADGGVSFSQIRSTKMACVEPAGVMRVERSILAALPAVARVEMRHGTLVLLDAGGSRLARLEPSGGP